MKKGFRFQDTNILNGGGDNRQVTVWVLTPTGTTTINSVHKWDKGNPSKEEELQWNDGWYWTENENS